MDSSYSLYACIDFKADIFAISIPLLKNSRSNYIYIPKTDHSFRVLDFYEIEELNYPTIPIPYDSDRQIKIGEKAPVPIIQNGVVYLAEPEWSEQEIAIFCPELCNQAKKAFLSLVSRLGSKPPELILDGIGTSVADLLIDPVRSRYWISKFSALVRSAFENGAPPEPLQIKLHEARMKWLDKFSTKTSLKNVISMLDIKEIPRDADISAKFLLARFEKILLSKGLFTPNIELDAYERLYPDGVLNYITDNIDNDESSRDRISKISRHIAGQMFELTQRSYEGLPKGSVLASWPTQELKRILKFLKIIGGKTHRMEAASGYLVELFQKALSVVQGLTSSRQDIINAVLKPSSGRKLSLDLLLNLTHRKMVVDGKAYYSVAVLLDEISEAYDRLILLSRIVRPMTRFMPEEDIAFTHVDHHLIDVIRAVRRTGDVYLLRELTTSHAKPIEFDRTPKNPKRK